MQTLFVLGGGVRVGHAVGHHDVARKPLPVLIAAEEQTAGRGRRGRRWHSAPGAGITFSLARRVDRPARELAALSLVAGVAVARALHARGVKAARLKWPNDLVVDGAKLGGILVETRNTNHAVIGMRPQLRRTPASSPRVRAVAFLMTLFDHAIVIQRVGCDVEGSIGSRNTGGGARAEWERCTRTPASAGGAWRRRT